MCMKSYNRQMLLHPKRLSPRQKALLHKSSTKITDSCISSWKKRKKGFLNAASCSLQGALIPSIISRILSSGFVRDRGNTVDTSVLFAQIAFPHSECRVNVCCVNAVPGLGHRLLHQPFLLFNRTMNTGWSVKTIRRKWQIKQRKWRRNGLYISKAYYLKETE